MDSYLDSLKFLNTTKTYFCLKYRISNTALEHLLSIYSEPDFNMYTMQSKYLDFTWSSFIIRDYERQGYVTCVNFTTESDKVKRVLNQYSTIPKHFTFCITDLWKKRIEEFYDILFGIKDMVEDVDIREYLIDEVRFRNKESLRAYDGQGKQERTKELLEKLDVWKKNG